DGWPLPSGASSSAVRYRRFTRSASRCLAYSSMLRLFAPPGGGQAPALRYALRAAFERAFDLIEMVVVVPGHEGHEIVDCHASPTGVMSGAAPRGGVEAPHELEGLVTPSAEGVPGGADVVSRVLALLGPPVGCSRLHEHGIVHG